MVQLILSECRLLKPNLGLRVTLNPKNLRANLIQDFSTDSNARKYKYKVCSDWLASNLQSVYQEWRETNICNNSQQVQVICCVLL